MPPFQSFLDEYRATVYRYLLAMVGPADADDCFQETFLAALRAYPKLRHGEDLRAWVMTIATRKGIDAGRARSRRPLAVEDVAAIADRGSDDPAMGGSDDRLWDAVKALPPRQRAAVVQRYVLDRPYDDIARVMGSTEETARQNVHQGLKRLRREWPNDERG